MWSPGTTSPYRPHSEITVSQPCITILSIRQCLFTQEMTTYLEHCLPCGSKVQNCLTSLFRRCLCEGARFLSSVWWASSLWIFSFLNGVSFGRVRTFNYLGVGLERGFRRVPFESYILGVKLRKIDLFFHERREKVLSLKWSQLNRPMIDHWFIKYHRLMLS